LNTDLEKQELIEMMGIHLQNQHSISPLTGRIWATIIMEGKEKGLTFDYLVEKNQASKSSVSSSLNILTSTNKIYFETVPGDRKKYFIAYPFSERFVRMLQNMQFEKSLLDKIIVYKEKEEKTAENNCSLQNIKAYKEHLLEIEQLTQKLLKKLKETEQKNLITNN
jgi:DNA-binding transcriptional regulator GbsR (MarR family)